MSETSAGSLGEGVAPEVEAEAAFTSLKQIKVRRRNSATAGVATVERVAVPDATVALVPAAPMARGRAAAGRECGCGATSTTLTHVIQITPPFPSCATFPLRM